MEMMRKLISCRLLIVLSCLVNWYACDRIIVRKRPQGNGNYSDILVTKHNYYSYLTNIPSKLPPRNQTTTQTSAWELISVNENDANVDKKNEQKINQGSFKVPQGNASTTSTDIYSFNCTLMTKPTTKLIPLLRKNTTFPFKFTPNPIRSPTRSPSLPKRPTRSSKKKIIYVNPPIISAVESVLNGAYDMVENALTTKEKVRLTTSSPNVRKRTKKSPNASKLITTQVHVTSEYEPITQMSILTSSQRSESDESGSSEEYYEEDLLYYDGDDDGDESSSDDDDSSADEDSIESPPVRAKPTILRPTKDHNLQAKPWIPPTGQEDINSAKPINAQENILKRKRRRPAAPSSSSEDSYEDYDDQEDEEDEFSLEDTFKYGSPVKENVFDYFGNVMSRFGKFITSLMGLGGGGKRKKQSIQQDNQIVSTYSTTPKNRQPKRPTHSFYDFHDHSELFQDQLGNDVEHKEVNDQGVHEKGMWSGLGTWFGGDNTETTTIPNEMTEDKSWFFNIFSSPTTASTTTTTEKPEITSLNPLDPGNFIALLAQHLVTTEKPDEQKPESLGGQVAQKKVDYSNYQLWRLRPSNAWQVRFLSTLRSSADCEKCQWWKGPSLRGPTDLAIPPESLAFIEETLQSQGIMYEAVISDLQKAITYSNPKMTRREHYEIEMEQGHPVTFYRYHRFDDIVKFLEFLQRKYPEHVELSHFGRSFEGLPLIMVKIFSQANGTMELRYGRGPRKRPTERKFLKPVVMIEAGSHGREWIAPAVAMWILNTLAMGIGRNDSQSEIYRSVDWLVVPVLNPDGYEYTHTHDRLWRKTRSRARPKKMGFLNSLPFWTWFQGDSTEEELNCTGVDLNRNWSYEWTPKGITSKPCGDLYSGSKALSEPESAALHQFAMKHKKRITVFISLHSYGQMISVPKELHGRNDDLIDMAHVAAQALNGHSSLNRYLVDDANEMLFPRPGAVDSFMLNTIGVPYSYTLELRDTGTHGFLLPPSYIEATARDAFDVIKAIVDNL